MSKCHECGDELSGSGKFCSECGAAQDGETFFHGDRLSGINLSGGLNGHSFSITPGETLFNGRYSIDSRIGSGGFGKIYLAFDKDANHPVALKIVPTMEGEEETAAEQLRNEKNLRRKINHFEHIIQVNDIYVDYGYKGLPLVLLSMEYADGGSLRGWITENSDLIKQEERRSEALKYFREACLGVETVHNAGLIHLDLKPENLLLLEGRVKVSDLGLSRNYIQYAQNQEIILKEHATLAYMSPEQFKSARQKDINHLSDIYSLGIILFELLDGNVPFDGKNFDEFKEKHLTYDPPPLKGALAPWSRIVGRCLSKEPGKRYQSVKNLLADLEWAEAGDVACNNCGYVNNNKDFKKCQKCFTDISHLFQHCPDCQRLNRLDVGTCPDCGFKVGRHFRLVHLLKEAREKSDLDPRESIRCLIEVLKLEAGNRDAKEMLPGLRKIQEKIESIIPEAKEAWERGDAEEARRKWAEVLKLSSRHITAVSERNKLDKTIDKYNKNYEKISELMNGGKFEKVEILLKECRTLIPTRKETDRAFKLLHERWSEYGFRLEKTKSEMRRKNLNRALRHVDLGLNEAPKSTEALSLKHSIGQDIEKTKFLFHKAKDSLNRAQFEQAKGPWSAAFEIQKDLRGIKNFAEQIEQKTKEYKRALKKAEKASTPELRDLNESKSELMNALKICPLSKEASTFLGRVEKEQKQAKELIKGSVINIKSAEFEEAESKIKEAECIWLKTPGLTRAREKLDSTQQDYKRRILRVKELYEKKKDLNPALDHTKAALKICPNSSEAKNLANEIDEAKKKADHLVKESVKNIRSAQFEKAESKIKEAECIWLKTPGLTRTREKLDSTQQDYKRRIHKAKELYEKKKDLSPALEHTEAALKICPNSSEAKSLANEIEEDQKKADYLLKEANSFLQAAVFHKVQERVRQVKSFWPRTSGLIKTERNLDITRKLYNNHISTARVLCRETRIKKDLGIASLKLLKGKYEDALEGCCKAVELCPKSKEAIDLKNEISSLIKEISSLARIKFERRKKRNKILFVILTIIWGCSIFLFVGSMVLKHIDLHVFIFNYFLWALIFNLLAYLFFSMFAPFHIKNIAGPVVLLNWLAFGALHIITYFVFNKAWMAGTSASLTISGVYISIVIIVTFRKGIE